MHYPLVVIASTFAPTSRIRQFPGFGDDTDNDDDEFVLTFDRLPELSNKTGLLEGVCKMLPISNLDFLSICASDSLNWVELFKGCKKLTALQVIGNGTSSLLRALTTPKITNPWRSLNWVKRHNSRDNLYYSYTSAQPARSTAAHTHTHIFPKLEYLSLKELDFSGKVHPSGILFDVVDTILRQRKAPRKVPLRMLHIDDCAISARRAKALQKLVEGSHWDGKEAFEYVDFDDYRFNREAYLDSDSDSDWGSESESDPGLESESD